MIAFGLDGIGKRALLERGVSDNLGLRWGPIFLMDSSRSAEDLYLWLLDETGDLDSRTKLIEEAEAFRRLPESAQNKEVLSRLHLLSDERTVPCIVDEGGLLERDGKYREQILDLITDFGTNDDDRYVAITHHRRPIFRPTDYPDFMPVRVGPLPDADMRLLLLTLARMQRLEIGEDAVQELVSYLDGYPPAADFVISLIQAHGIDAGPSPREVDTRLMVTRQAAA